MPFDTLPMHRKRQRIKNIRKTYKTRRRRKLISLAEAIDQAILSSRFGTFSYVDLRHYYLFLKGFILILHLIQENSHRISGNFF